MTVLFKCLDKIVASGCWGHVEMNKSKYSWYVDPKVIQDTFKDCSPFNTVSDFKRCLHGRTKWFIDELENNIFIRSFDTLTSITSKKTNFLYSIVKTRIADPESRSGKSGGFRCVALLDDGTKEGIPLHIYNKAEKKDLTQHEKNQIKILLKQYVDSVEREI